VLQYRVHDETPARVSYEFASARPYADPEVAARKLIELANAVEAVQDGRIYIELLNGTFLFELKATCRIPPGSSWRSRTAGSRCTRAGPT
jgi:hypothetical protein